MYILLKKFIICCCLLFPLNLLAADTAFVEGKHYIVVASAGKKTDSEKVKVYEFFSPGCPACYYLEPHIQQWLERKPQQIEFERVPVIFSPQWTQLAKAYYAAVALDVGERLTQAMFDAMHEQGKSLQSEAEIKALFVANGVSAEDFDSVFHFSPSIDAQLNRARELMREYRIAGVPGFVVADKYKTDAQMVGGNVTRLMQLIDYLANN
jgi:thiol:disulfide interchange protein DsbA